MERIEHSGMEPPRREAIDRVSRPDGKVGRAEDQKSRPVSKDQVTLSERARLLSRLKQAVDDSPDVREDRVRELRQAIENGSYKPDDREIAKQILGLEEE